MGILKDITMDMNFLNIIELPMINIKYYFKFYKMLPSIITYLNLMSNTLIHKLTQFYHSINHYCEIIRTPSAYHQIQQNY